jgi:serine/threonine protein kinase
MGLDYVHSRRIMHRDLKPSNIFFDEFHRPRIGDFGTSRLLVFDITLTESVGTPLYMAPEMYSDDDSVAYTYTVDMYSLGLILYEIISGNCLCDGRNMKLFVKLIRGGRSVMPESVFPQTRSLIERCWSSNAANRPTCSQIFEELVRMDFEVIPGVNSREVFNYIEWAIGTGTLLLDLFHSAMSFDHSLIHAFEEEFGIIVPKEVYEFIPMHKFGSYFASTPAYDGPGSEAVFRLCMDGKSRLTAFGIVGDNRFELCYVDFALAFLFRVPFDNMQVAHEVNLSLQALPGLITRARTSRGGLMTVVINGQQDVKIVRITPPG